MFESLIGIMKHHTKDKGDIGVAHVIADLVERGLHVCTPLSEHLPFDLIAVRNNGETLKISVKYRTVKKGSIVLRFRSTYSDSKRTITKKIEKELIDVIAIYCPNNKQVYYIDPNKFEDSVTLRVEYGKKKQEIGVHKAEDYLAL